MNKSFVSYRTKLVDEPLVKLILSKKYSKSDIKFISSYRDKNSLMYRVNGTQRNLIIKRNSSKYFKSPNFTLSVDKESLVEFEYSTFVFIDEVSNSLYLVEGNTLLEYILHNQDKIIETDSSRKCILIPKKSITDTIKDDAIIKYNKHIAKLFELSRNEDLYIGI